MPRDLQVLYSILSIMMQLIKITQIVYYKEFGGPAVYACIMSVFYSMTCRSSPDLQQCSNAGFKCMFQNHVFCPIVLYINPSRAECVFPHLRCATFLSFDIKTIAKMRQKPQHVENISSDAPYMLRFSSRSCNGFYIKWQKCGAT